MASPEADDDAPLVKETTELIQILRPLARHVEERHGAQELEEVLAHLEGTDDAFHRYGLVKELVGRVNDLIQPFLALPPTSPTSLRDSGRAADVVEEIVSSSQFQALRRELSSELQSAVDTVLCDPAVFAPTTGGKADEFGGDAHSPSSPQHWSAWADDFSPDVYGESFFGILPQEQELSRISAGLGSDVDSVCLEAIKQLSSISPADLTNCDLWPEIRVQLSQLLQSQNPHIVAAALRFHARSFQVSAAAVAKEVFLHFTSHLSSLFAEPLACFSGEFDTSQPQNDRVLKQLHLLNEFQHQLQSYWPRMGETSVCAAVDASLELLLHYAALQPANGISPRRLSALIDPRATWFTNWLGAAISRTHVLAFFRDHRVVIESLAVSVLEFTAFLLESRTAASKRSGMKPPRHLKFRRSSSQVHEHHVYTDQQIKYLDFTQSICILSNLLFYRGGRLLFPVELQRDKLAMSDSQLLRLGIEADSASTTVMLSDDNLIEILIRIMQQPLASAALIEEGRNYFDPSVLAADLLKAIAKDCSERLAKDKFLLRLTEPLLQACNAVSPLELPPPSLLLDIADTLGLVASCGNDCILCSNREIALRVSRFLVSMLRLKSSDINCLVISSFIVVCRQVYRSCRGLRIVDEVELHRQFAHSFRNNRNTPLGPIVLDGLLNFAGTPKGVLRLASEGHELVKSCLELMASRYQQKLQVSKYEKFGYGVMASEVCTTRIGAELLCQIGFAKWLFENLKVSAEEFVGYDVPQLPQAVNLKKYEKCLYYVLTLLSSFTSVCINGASPTKNEFVSFINEFALTNDSDVLNEDQCHWTGLRLIEMASCDLNALLLLEATTDLQQRLLQLQKEAELAPGLIVVDPQSLLRNRILLNTVSLGGPSERIVPALTIADGEAVPALFCSLPPPDVYLPAITLVNREDLCLPEVSDNPLRDMLQLVRDEQCNLSAAQALLHKWQVINSSADKSSERSESTELARPFEYGVGLVASYAARLGVIDSESDFIVRLRSLMSHFHGRHLDHAGFCKRGFDWFVAAVACICSNNESCIALLDALALQPQSRCFWPARKADDNDLSDLPPIYHTVAHAILELVTTELPLLANAFRLSGVSVSHIVMHWMMQSFWNYLDFGELVHYVLLCILGGPKYQVAFCVAILQHLSSDILQHCQDRDLLFFEVGANHQLFSPRASGQHRAPRESVGLTIRS
eukprot:m.115272 g.115272  ORF g.115272 m.115272 type:complete len:1205 (-) comp9472_c0_seq1:104-3718(-)